MDPRRREAIIVLRHALQLLDSLELGLEAALVSQALETMTATITPAATAEAG
ncbi:MAG: hypothetical protein ABW173_10625 [Sphingomonas sp.]